MKVHKRMTVGPVHACDSVLSFRGKGKCCSDRWAQVTCKRCLKLKVKR